MLGCLAAEGTDADWERWRAQMARYVRESAYVEVDLAQLLDIAGERADDGGRPRRAAAARELAAELWQRLRA